MFDQHLQSLLVLLLVLLSPILLLCSSCSLSSPISSIESGPFVANNSGNQAGFPWDLFLAFAIGIWWWTRAYGLHIEKYCAIFGTWLFTRWVVSFYSEHFLVVMYSGCSFLPFSLTRCLFSSALKHISISLHVWSQPGPIQTQCIWWAISSTFLLLFFMIGDAPRESTREQQPMETSTMQQTMNRYAQCTWIVRRTKRKIELEQLIITI